MNSPDTRRPLRELALAFAGVALICTVWLFADHVPRLYMGDSMSFLQLGSGRSPLYNVTLQLLVFPQPPALAVLGLQACWSALTCLGLFAFLRYVLALDFSLALVAAMALATEPAQVFMARMLMAETYGLLALACTFLVLSRYLATGSLGWYLLGALGGLATASIRISFLPLVTGLCIAAPLLLVLAKRGSEGPARVKFGSVCSAWVVLAACHLAYTHAYGYATKQAPGYLANTGLMRIGLVAPLIRKEHFAGTGVSGDVLDEVERPLRDMWERGNHIWEDDGLYRVLERHSANPEMVARTITHRAMLDAPLELLSINLRTLGGYFDPHKRYWRMQDDLGVIPPDDQGYRLIEKLTPWNIRGVNLLESPARRYFAASWPWLTACLFMLAPLGLAAIWIGWKRPDREQYLLLGLASLGLVASHLLFAHIISFRYLHPFPWFVLANLAMLASAITRLIRSRSGTGPDFADRPFAGSRAGRG